MVYGQQFKMPWETGTESDANIESWLEEMIRRNPGISYQDVMPYLQEAFPDTDLNVYSSIAQRLGMPLSSQEKYNPLEPTAEQAEKYGRWAPAASTQGYLHQPSAEQLEEIDRLGDTYTAGMMAEEEQRQLQQQGTQGQAFEQIIGRMGEAERTSPELYLPPPAEASPWHKLAYWYRQTLEKYQKMWEDEIGGTPGQVTVISLDTILRDLSDHGLINLEEVYRSGAESVGWDELSPEVGAHLVSDLIRSIDKTSAAGAQATETPVLPTGWTTEVIESAESPTGYVVNYKTPGGWTITYDFKYIDPEGNEYTEEQMADIEDLAKKMGELFPDQDMQELMRWGENDPLRFARKFQEIGETPKAKAVLKRLGLNDEQIDNLYIAGVDLGEVLNKGKTPETDALMKKLFPNMDDIDRAIFFYTKGGRQFFAGIGDVIAGMGGAAKWMGLDGIGETLSTKGRKAQTVALPDELGEFNWQHLFMPEFHAVRGAAWRRLGRSTVRSLPFTLSLIPAMILGAYAGASSAAAIGLGAFGRLILGSLGATALSRPMESALEAGGTYDQALEKGYSKESAKKAADSVFFNNLKLAGLDVAELSTAFMPIQGKVLGQLLSKGLIRTGMVGGKLVVTGLTEAGEEALQEMIQRQALGEDIEMDAAMQEVMAIGFIMGMGFGTVGETFNSIKSRVQDKLPVDIKEQFNEEFNRLKEQGKTDEQADLLALDSVSNKPAVAQIVQDVMDEIKQEEMQKDLAMVSGEKFKEGDIVEDSKGRQWTVVDAESDPSMLTVKSEKGTTTKIGRGTVKLVSSQEQGPVTAPAGEAQVTQKVAPVPEQPEIAAAEVTTPPTKETQRPTPQATEEPRQAEIIRELSEKLNVPIRRGHYRGKALGIYKVGKEIIRWKKGQVKTIAHEVGHLIDERLFKYGISKNISRAELAPLLEEYPNPKQKHIEAFAEFMRYYLTDPERAQSKAPKFFKYFEETMASYPDVMDILLQAREDYLRWEQLPATAKVSSQIVRDVPKSKVSFMERIDKFYTDVFNSMYPIRRFVKQAQKLGLQVLAEEDPSIAAQLIAGEAGRVNAFLEHGTYGKKFWKTNEKGKIVPNYKGKSFKEIMKKVKDNIDDFSTYLTSKHAMELTQYGVETGIAFSDAQDAANELDSKYPHFKDVAEDIYQYQKQVLEYAYEAGLIGEDLLEKLGTKYRYYVPFFRYMEELQRNGHMGKGFADIRSPIKRIKGSEREIIDPIESIVKNTYVIMDAADRNMVGIMLARLAQKDKLLTQMFERIPPPMARVATVTAEDLGLNTEMMDPVDAERIINIFRPSLFNSDENILCVSVGGKQQYYQVDPDLYQAIHSMQPQDLGMIWQMLSYPAKWLRAGAVLNPDFWISKNPIRDTMSAFLYSRYGFVPIADTLRGFFEYVGRGEQYQLWRMSGGERSMMVSMDREYLQKNLKEMMEGKIAAKKTEIKEAFQKGRYGKATIITVNAPLDALQQLAEFTESGTRIGEFKKGLEAGATPIEAGYASREVTLDFFVKGAKTKSLAQLIAFFNANLRAADKVAREARYHPKTFFPKALLGITLPSILLYLANRDDDRYKQMEMWEKNLFWIFFAGDAIIRIPKPFEPGLVFGSMVERLLEYMDTQDRSVLDEGFKSIIEMANPGWIPTAALPWIENTTNWSFFRERPVVSEALEDMPPELQYNVYTPELIKKFGEWLDYPPLKIENLLYGYTGGLGRYVVQILDGILKGTGILPSIPQPTPTLADIPVLKSLIVRNPYGSGSRSVTVLYDKLEELNEGEKYLKQMIQDNQEEKFNKYKQDHPELMFFFDYETGELYSSSRRFLDRTTKQLSELRKKQREVHTSMELSPDEKRQKIDEIDKLITDTARLALEHLENMPAEFSEDGVTEPYIEDREFYDYMEHLPKYLMDHLWAEKEEQSGEAYAKNAGTVEKWTEAEKALMEKYQAETKDMDTWAKGDYRAKHPELDAALNFRGDVSSVKSLEALELLQKKADELGIPHEVFPALKDEGSKRLEIELKHREEFQLYEQYGDKESKNYIADEKVREKKREDMIAADPEFAGDRRRLEAYRNEVPEDLIENYVEYYEHPIGENGYTGERYLLDNPRFYAAMLDLGLITNLLAYYEPRTAKAIQGLGYRLIPDKELEKLIITYMSLPTSGTSRDSFLKRYPALYEWMILIGQRSAPAGFYYEGLPAPPEGRR